MKDEIQIIYSGLPENFKKTTLWVAKPNRSNKKFNLNVGSDIIIEYHNGVILGFHWIKTDSKYIMRILLNQLFKSKTLFKNYTKKQKLSFIKKNVCRVYGRIYEKDKFKDIPFEKIWDADNDYKFPWQSFEQFQDYIDFNKYWDIAFEKMIIEENEVINKEFWYVPKSIEKWDLN